MALGWRARYLPTASRLALARWGLNRLNACIASGPTSDAPTTRPSSLIPLATLCEPPSPTRSRRLSVDRVVALDAVVVAADLARVRPDWRGVLLAWTGGRSDVSIVRANQRSVRWQRSGVRRQWWPVRRRRQCVRGQPYGVPDD